MNAPTPEPVSPPASLLGTAHGRQRLVTVALRLAHGTALAPGPYECRLLDQFVRGLLTLDEVASRLEVSEPGDAY